MVWHAYMLNPRCFFEDCIRYGKLDLWATGLPWAAVNACIDNSSFEYRTSEEAHQLFETSSGRPWDNLRDASEKPLECPRCLSTTAFPWTTSTVELPCAWDRLEKVLTDEGRGYGDKDFSAVCGHCDFVFSHEKLRVQKFKRDVQLLLNDDFPMPGTILSMDGKPIDAKAVDGAQNHLASFPNRLLYAERSRWLELIADHKQCFNDMNWARSHIELALHDKNLTRRLKGTSVSWKLISEAEIAVRRMMSRYWDNHSMFALDLVGAVIRQGSFIEKMHNIDWLHSLTLSSTMIRLIHKYTRFFEIMRRKKMSRGRRRIAVPTLDVDLVWHTHQLSPPNYYRYSEDMTKRFIDHDDKIAQDALSDAFKWTSRTYQKMFGQVYSECICWYCEAIRESHTSIVPVPRIVRSASATAAEQFHAQNPCGDSIPRACECPHISAHNAVKPDFGKGSSESDAAAFAAEVHAKQLERSFQKACQRAKKKGRKAPVREEYHDSNAYSAYGPWAYPIAVPYSLPYAADPCITANMYLSNPAGMVVAPEGAPGFCVAGACGGTVAAGACVGGCGGGGSSSGGNGGCGGCGGCGG
jgi:Glycine-rich domain-containing protein-like